MDFLERDIDAFAGWAGDLLQMGGGLQNTLNFGGYNYFTPEDLQTIIGAPANGLQNYHLYGKNGEEMSIKDGGFSHTVGRGSTMGMGKAFEKLEPQGTKWHHLKWISILGSYLLIMFLHYGRRLDALLCIYRSYRQAGGA